MTFNYDELFSFDFNGRYILIWNLIINNMEFVYK